MATECEANEHLEVTIFLVENLSMAKQSGGASSKKRRRASSESAHGITVGEVMAKAGRLRQCSTYFDACLSERWARSKHASEILHFHLEVHTEVRYYKDCFSRMHCLFKPITSVAGCIELLKVASQIGFQDVIDVGVKFLASTPWTDDEEILIRAFRASNLVNLASLTELTARSPIGEEANLKQSTYYARSLLNCTLQNAIPGFNGSSMAEAGKKCYNCRQKFEGAFHLVVSGAELGVGDAVVKHALHLLKEASLFLLFDLKDSWEIIGNGTGNSREKGRARMILSNFCWLFRTAQKAHAAQTVVEVLLDDFEVSDVVRQIHVYEMWLPKWAKMIHSVFEGVMEGTLFLSNEQRNILFNEWQWVLSASILDIDEEDFIARFVSTFPKQQQEDIWMSVDFGIDFEPSVEAYTKWVCQMITSGKAKWKLAASSIHKSGGV